MSNPQTDLIKVIYNEEFDFVMILMNTLFTFLLPAYQKLVLAGIRARKKGDLETEIIDKITLAIRLDTNAFDYNTIADSRLDMK